MEDDIEVSVIIPAYNREEAILRSIKSVLEQTFSDFEIIVVDDGSTDHTVTEIGKITDPRVRVVRHNHNIGANAARNTGIKAARGFLVAFQDSDDEWLSTKLEKQVDVYYRNNISAKVIYCNFKRQVKGADEWKIVPDVSHGPLSGDISDRLITGNVVNTPTALIEKALLLENLFDESLPRFQDWELFIRLSKLTPFYHVNEVLVNSYLTPGSISSSLESTARAVQAIILKHKEFFLNDKIALARWSFFAGDIECRNGDAGKGRWLFSQGALPYGKHAKYWIAYVLSFLPKAYYSFFMDFLKCLKQKVSNSNSGFKEYRRKQ